MAKRIAVLVRDRQGEALRMALGITLLGDIIDVIVLASLDLAPCAFSLVYWVASTSGNRYGHEKLCNNCSIRQKRGIAVLKRYLNPCR